MFQAYREFYFRIFKENHTYQGPGNYGGGTIANIMHAPDGSDVKDKDDDTFTVNKGHITASEDATQSLSDIRQYASDCGTLICGFS